jgi:serine-type D-Ala-D-Ala carboxypeptidase (penicillin-binding protein 5/6)
MTAALRMWAAAICAAVLTGVLPAAAAAQSEPTVSARSAVVVEASTGRTVFAKAPNARRPIASTTKLMTALLVLERASLDDVYAAARYDALPIESKIDLRTGERMNVRDLLRALLLASANDAAVTLAVGTSGSQRAFVRDMNRRARQLGLENTRFANPVGLDTGGGYSSAADLARLTLRLRRNAFFRETVDRPRALSLGSPSTALTTLTPPREAEPTST